MKSTAIPTITLRIKYWRKRRNLTLKQLEARTGIPFQQLGLYEQGKVSPPAARIQRIAAGLEISVSQLFPKPRKPSEVAALVIEEEPVNV
jgi:transcriptional regulator with XRE-family HTH domain